MKLLRTTALSAALMTAAVPMLTSPAHAWGWGWRGGGWGWGGAALGLAAGALIGSALAAPYYAYGYGYPAYGYGYGYPGYGYGYGKVMATPRAMPMAPATAIQLTATDMGPATAIQLTATDMGPATATRVTAMLITPLSDALSMPPLSASGVIGALNLAEPARNQLGSTPRNGATSSASYLDTAGRPRGQEARRRAPRAVRLSGGT